MVDFQVELLARGETAIRRLLRRVFGFWAARSILVGCVGTSLDLSLLLLGVEVLGLPRVPCVTAGVVLGGVVGFVLNRRFAFRDKSHEWGAQAMKYALLVLTEIVLHTGLTSTFVHWAELHYLPAKFSADFLVFTCLHLLALRYVVFPRRRAVALQPKPALESSVP